MEELLRALDEMATDDLVRLHCLAGKLAERTRGAIVASDLYHEAIVRTLDGRRSWSREAKLWHHLGGAMCSIADHAGTVDSDVSSQRFDALLADVEAQLGALHETFAELAQRTRDVLRSAVTEHASQARRVVEQREQSDAELIALATSDERAGARLVARHSRSIHAWFMLNVRDVSTADELTQETMLGLFEAIAQNKTIHNVRAYLRGTAYHKLCTYYRERSRPLELREDLDKLTAEQLETEGTAWTAVAQRERDMILAQALRRIPLEDQLLLSCFYWDHLKRKEIAALLEVPVGTVGSRLNKARTRLHRQLDLIERGRRPFHETTRPVEKWRDFVHSAEPDSEPESSE